MRALAFTLVLAAGCVPKTAVINGREVPRLDLDLTGDPYRVHHTGAHPSPGGPSGGLNDAGGDISGRICGMFGEFEVRHAGDRVEIVGAFDGDKASHLTVRDAAGRREITGQLGNLAVELALTGTSLQGHVGLRVFALEQDGDRLVGALRLQNWYDPAGNPGVTRAVVEGREALWSLPAADQALLAAALLTCQMPGAEARSASPGILQVRIGGPAGDRPASTSSLYRRGE